MEATGIEKVFHYARFDVAAMASGLGIAVNPIFCTRWQSLTAHFLQPRHGLAAVVSELVGVDLDKQAQKAVIGVGSRSSASNSWPAANDVRYLLPARDRLEQMLVGGGALELGAALLSLHSRVL